MKKILPIALIIIVAIVGIVIIRKQKKKNTEERPNSATGSNSASDNGFIKKPLPDSPFPLKRGSTGKNVLALQRGLNKVYNAGLDEDAVFGEKTEKACVKYLKTKVITLPKYLEKWVQ